MWLSRIAGLPAVTVLFISLWRECMAGPTYLHEAVSDDGTQRIGQSISPSSVSPLPLHKRVQHLEPKRIVEFLRETINIAAREDPDPNGNRVWRICLEHVSHFLFTPATTLDPVENVANKLDRLYDLAMATIYELIEAHNYPQDEHDNFFTLRLGQVAIEWSCNDGPLCWHLLHDFCLIMREKARQGWTGMYDGQLINVGTGVVTWVRLTIRKGRNGGDGVALPKRGLDKRPLDVGGFQLHRIH